MPSLHLSFCFPFPVGRILAYSCKETGWLASSFRTAYRRARVRCQSSRPCAEELGVGAKEQGNDRFVIHLSQFVLYKCLKEIFGSLESHCEMIDCCKVLQQMLLA